MKRNSETRTDDFTLNNYNTGVAAHTTDDGGAGRGQGAHNRSGQITKYLRNTERRDSKKDGLDDMSLLTIIACLSSVRSSETPSERAESVKLRKPHEGL